MQLKLFIIRTSINLIHTIEKLGTLPDKSFYYSLRLFMYVAIISAFMFGSLLKSDNSNSYALSYIFDPDISTVAVGSVKSAQTQAFPIIKSELLFPDLSAKSIIAVDLTNNKILYEKAMYQRFPPASTTKLMTALVALDIYSLEDQLIVPLTCTEVASTRLGLISGEVLYVSDLLHALLISSSGDAACTLASNIRYINTSDSEVEQNQYLDALLTSNINLNRSLFIDKMNAKAVELKLENTNFANEIGLDGPNNSQYSTAYDLYILAKNAVSIPVIAEIVAKPSYEITSEVPPINTFTEDIVINEDTISAQDTSTPVEVNEEINTGINSSSTNKVIYNTNELLNSYPNTTGIKTGTTTGAGEVFIYGSKDSHKDLIIVIMNSTARFVETTAILDWINASYSWDTPNEN